MMEWPMIGVNYEMVMERIRMPKHVFTEEKFGDGYCGHQYCTGNHNYWYETSCTCGKKWSQKLDDTQKTKHVLEAEGLM